MSNTTISPPRSNLFQTSQIASNYGLNQMAFIASMGGRSHVETMPPEASMTANRSLVSMAAIT